MPLFKTPFLTAVDRYIFRLVLMPMLGVFVIAASLLILDKMLKLFDFVATEGGPVSVVFRLLANLLPEYASLAVPLALLMGILLAFRKLATTSELDTMRAVGLSYTRLLRVPFLLVLFIVTFFDAAVHQGYFLLTDGFLRSIGIPGNWVMPIMSIGQIAEIGTIVFSPLTPVVATMLGSVPLYETPIMALLPVLQVASTGFPARSYAVPRPASQSIVALADSISARSPVVGQPSESLVPIVCALTTA